MLLAMLNSYKFQEIIASDINGELINMYVQVRDNPDSVISSLKEKEELYNSKTNEDERKELYCLYRTEYNKHITGGVKNSDTAALLITLNKLCFNGLYRVNRDGLFNVPFGKKKTANLADYDNLKEVSRGIRNVRFIEGSYESSMIHASKGTLYYFDSPYRPVSNTASFTSYARSSFNDDSQIKLASMTEALQKKGASFVLSNSDPTETDPDDTFFTDLYTHGVIEKVEARRAISASGGSRKTVSEILVIG